MIDRYFTDFLTGRVCDRTARLSDAPPGHYRSISPVDRLNEQAVRIEELESEVARLREALAHVGICPSCKGFGWVVLVHEVDGEVVREPRMCVSCEGRKLQTPAWHALGCPDCATVPTVEEFLAAEALGEVRDDER